MLEVVSTWYNDSQSQGRGIVSSRIEHKPRKDTPSPPRHHPVYPEVKVEVQVPKKGNETRESCEDCSGKLQKNSKNWLSRNGRETRLLDLGVNYFSSV